MKRRTVLARVGALGVAGLAGCVSDGGGSEPETDSETATQTDRTPMTPTLDGTTIEVLRNECGQQTSDATVRFEDDAVVVVEGTIWAPTPGWTATISAADYDAAADELAIRIGLRERDTTGAVVQCIAEIEYRATATFSGALPRAVTVTHETDEGAETVATAQHD